MGLSLLESLKQSIYSHHFLEMGCCNSSINGYDCEEVPKDNNSLTKGKKEITHKEDVDDDGFVKEPLINHGFLVFDKSTFMLLFKNAGENGDTLKHLIKLYIVCITSCIIKDLERKIKHENIHNQRIARSIRDWVIENQKKNTVRVQAGRDHIRGADYVASDPALDYALYLNEHYPNRVMIISNSKAIYNDVPEQFGFSSDSFLALEELLNDIQRM